MNEMIFSYEPLSFSGEASAENRVTKEQFTRKIELEGTAAFIKTSIVNPFEEAFIERGLESLACGSFCIERKSPSATPSVSWKSVYEGLKAFLDIRADDSRAGSHEDVKPFEGIGYCIDLSALQKQIKKLVSDATSTPSSSPSVKWPTKKKDEQYPIRILVPRREYYAPTQENGITVLQAKRFCSGIGENFTSLFENELKRWFEANTGYNPPKKIPDKKTKHVERTIELVPGSYIQVQLVRKEEPQYKEAIARIDTALAEIEENKPVQLFRHTTDDGKHYINIKSLSTFLAPESLEKNKLTKEGYKYVITP